MYGNVSPDGVKAIVRFRPQIAAMLIGPALLAACQTDNSAPPKLSLDEAKQVTATFEGSLAPPPRTINDILLKLDQIRASSRHCSDDRRFSSQEIFEMASKLPVPKKGAKNNRANFLAHHADQQFLKGDFPRSVKFQEAAVDAIPSDIRGYLASNIAVLASYYAFANDFDSARSAMSRATAVANRVKKNRWGGSEKQYAYFRFRLDVARAAVAAGNGDLIEADANYRRAIARADENYLIGTGVNLARMAMARNTMRQGRLLEAENAIRVELHLHSTFRGSAPPSPSTLLALVRLSEVLYEQGRYEEAIKLAQRTVDLYHDVCAASANLNLAMVNDLLGRALVAEEHWTEAAAQYESIRHDMTADPDSFDRLFTGNLYWALALLRTGQTDRAVKQLDVALRRTRDRLGDKHYKTAELRGYMAMALVAQGDRETALGEFADVVRILLRRSREADEDSSTVTARDRRLRLIVESYIALLGQIIGTSLEQQNAVDAVAEAFKLAEHARSQSVRRALSASGARASLSDPELAELARREQDTQKRIAALYGTLAEVVSRLADLQDRDLAESLKVKIDNLRGARAALMEEIESRFPDYAQLVNPKPATIEQARTSLRPGEALIATYVAEDASYVWAVPYQGEVAFAAVPLGRQRIEAVVTDLRRALDPQAATLGDIPDFDVALSHQLYRALLDPVKQGWQEAKSLLVVAHGALGQLPLSLLVTAPTQLEPERGPLFARYKEVPWLARSHAVTTLPSVASLTTLRRLPAGNTGRRAFAGFGDPWFSAAQAAEAATEKPTETAALTSRGILAVRGLPVRLRNLPKMDAFDSAELARLPRLPDTRDEVRSIALAMNADLTRDVFTGKDANEGQVKTMELSGYKVLAFATHGLVPGDLNGLTQPALALSAPEVAGVEGDGLLTMAEILGLRLDADWVVLSACNTASGDGAGADAVSGLGRAFFYAGTRALLVSNWPVETTSATALTTDLFRRQSETAGLDRAEALRQARMALIDGPGYVDAASGKIVFSYAHPIFWAPFTLIGDGGGAGPGA